MNPTLNDLTDTLYAQPPRAFTAARDAEIATAKNAGDRALATGLSGLKRPSQSAWLVNLLALRRPGTLETLVELGQTIRAAQGSVTPQQLRDLSGRRRTELDAALRLVEELARQAGEAAPSRAQLAEVEGTLAAAMADPEAAGLVRAGRLLKAMTYSGFGMSAGGADSGLRTLGAGGARAGGAGGSTGAASNTATKNPAAASGTTDAARRAEEAAAEAAQAAATATARLDAARERLADADRAHTAAAAAETELQQQIDVITTELAELSARLDILGRQARAARAARLATERDLASAQRRLDRLAP